MKIRSIPLAIIFTFITLGLYGIYWFVCLTNDSNTLAKSKTASAGLAVFYSIITCGIYGFYWIYMLGVKDGEISGNGSRGILYLVLSFIGLGFFAPILTQSTINNALSA